MKQQTNTTGLIRVFMNGTAYFVTLLKPFDLMAQRGSEIKFVGTLDNAPDTEQELRREIKHADLGSAEYVDTMFDTPAETLNWWQQAS